MVVPNEVGYGEVKPGFVPITGIPVVAKEETTVSAVHRQVAPADMEPTIQRITLDKDSRLHRRQRLLINFADGFISENAPWFDNIKQLVRRKINLHPDPTVFAESFVDSGTEYLALSASAADLLLKTAKTELSMMPLEVSENLMWIKKGRDQWPDVLPGYRQDYTWSQVKQITGDLVASALSMESDQDLQASQVHEEQHVNDSNRYQQLELQLSQLLYVVSEHVDVNLQDKELQKHVKAVFELYDQAEVIREVEAILHEVFLARVLPPPEKAPSQFQVPQWSYRAAQLLSTALEVEQQRSAFAVEIDRMVESGKADGRELYDAATLILVCRGTILSQKPGQLFDFSAWADHTGAVNGDRVLADCIEQIVRIYQDPTEFARMLADPELERTVLQALRKNRLEFAEQLLQLVEQFPEAVPANYPTGKIRYLAELVTKLENEAR